jgi:hypothetical protein
MLSKLNPGVRRSLGQFLRPISQPISRALSTADLISRDPPHVIKLLLNCWLAPRTRSQPDVYPFAAYLAERFGCTHVIATGRPGAADLLQLYPKYEVIGIVPGRDMEFYRNQYGFGTWLEESETLAGALPGPEEVLQRAVIVCNDLDKFVSSAALLKNLKLWLDHAPVCILTATDRDLARAGSNGLPPTTTGSGRWNLIELQDLLDTEGFNLEFIGWTAGDNVSYEKNTIMAVITNHAGGKQSRRSAPSDFRVVAFMAAYNEEDIIVQSIKKWTDQGIQRARSRELVYRRHL